MRRMRLCPIPKMAASCLICLTMTALWSDLSFAFPLSMMLKMTRPAAGLRAILRHSIPDPRTHRSSSESTPIRPITGIIIDARGLGLERGVNTRIRRADGTVLWDSSDSAERQMAYARTIAEAISRAGANPLVIRASGRFQDVFLSDPVISDSEWAKVTALTGNDSMLKAGRIVLLVDL